MSIPDRLVKMAMLGTDRDPVVAAAIAGDAALEKLAGVLQDRTPQAQVLALAAAAWLRDEAGATPALDDSMLREPSAPDPVPACSTEAEAILFELLEGGAGLKPVLGEWLDLAARSGQRVPDRYVARVLDARKGRGNSAVVDAACGTLGAWLAPQMGLQAEQPEMTELAQWPTASIAARRRWLEELRRTDSRAAREVLEENLAGESAENRAELLLSAWVGLGPDDQPLLAAMRRDRGRDVRDAATAMLSTLPGSPLNDEWRAHLAKHVHRAAKGFSIEWPEPEKEAAKLKARTVFSSYRGTTNHKQGPKAVTLSYQLRVMAPRTWHAVFGMGAAEVLGLMFDSEDAELLFSAYTEGALSHRDGMAAAAILRHVVAGSVLLEDEFLEALLALLPPDECRALVLDVIGPTGLLFRKVEANAVKARLLMAFPGEWPRALSEIVAMHYVKFALFHYPANRQALVLEIANKLPMEFVQKVPGADDLAPAAEKDWEAKRLIPLFHERLQLRARLARVFPP